MAHQFIQVEREGPLTLITLNRADVLNALHPPAHHELAEVFDVFASDPQQWVAIVTGSGLRAFCAGNDLKFRATHGRQSMPETGFAGLTSRFDLDKPVIAAVNGLALGGGFELALACDLVVADEHAQFGLPEVTVGAAAMAGGLHRLPRLIGVQAAMGLALTGRRIGAREAFALGCVNEVSPAGAAMDVARRWAQQILQAAPLAVRAAKQVMLRGLYETTLRIAMANQDNYPAVSTMRASEDYLEGPRAFADGRVPGWRAR
ncbi:MAG TPA: enoyl-CoA hydratase-related protein [Steroidobacteraceae bacterium]|nr:enoyl-CoA hydratase-related protein [Steroidobacteraceae bacterium]